MFGLFESKEDKKVKLVRRGMQAMSCGDFNSAEGLFLKAIAVEVWNAPEAWIGLGSLYLSNKIFDKARDCFESALGQAPNDFHAIRGMAYVEKMVGNESHAVELYKKLHDNFEYKPNEDPMLTAEDRNWLSEHGV